MNATLLIVDLRDWQHLVWIKDSYFTETRGSCFPASASAAGLTHLTAKGVTKAALASMTALTRLLGLQLVLRPLVAGMARVTRSRVL